MQTPSDASSHRDIQSLPLPPRTDSTAQLEELPDELLVQIFLELQPILREAPTRSRDRLPPLAGPWLLSTISHRWRRIALSLASLWSMVEYEDALFLRHADRADALSEMYRLQLHRSGTSKLRVVVNLLGGGPHQYTVEMQQILWSSSSRWAELDIDDGAPGRDRHEAFVFDPQCDLSSLQKVYTGRSDDLERLLPKAPGLETIVHRQFSGVPDLSPHTGVTQLVLNPARATSRYLGAFPNLETLVLADYHLIGLRADETPLVLGRLRHLHLTLQRTDTSALFDHLRFPALESLFVEGKRSGAYINAVHALLQASGCSGITALAFRLDPTYGSERWAHLLGETPYLEHLRILIHYKVKSWRAIAALSILGWNSKPSKEVPTRLKLCPHLTTIELDVYCHEESPESYSHMVTLLSQNLISIVESRGAHSQRSDALFPKELERVDVRVGGASRPDGLAQKLSSCCSGYVTRLSAMGMGPRLEIKARDQFLNFFDD
ncbi:hypothetical protein BDV98DRAFT_577631 [Pterulicium gracile]|uniref:F-box domain-containing protein n=1 Tax=Pterulicium gracile TaxID=1884261 RepID=A0A5C3Q559_9AGAR|nr:hypothetical protein BDV98DRAFT_577631 [Pterula gracilis]